MSWRPLTEILPVVDAGAERAAIVATGGVPETTAVPLHVKGAVAAPRQLFRAGASEQEMAAQDAAHKGEAEQKERARKEAHEEGMSLARAEGEALAMRYRGAIEELVAAREETIKTCEADLVRLALTIAREVLMADVAGQEQYAQRMAQHALQMLQGSGKVTLRIGSKDLAGLRQHKPELLRRDDVVIVEDEGLDAGGVVAEGSKGRIDATFSARLSAMAQTLLPQHEVLT